MRQFWLSCQLLGILGGLLFFCYDSLNSGCLLLLAAMVPIKTYSNAEDNKAKILKENKKKSGIYMLTNLKNGKQYIGSSNNLKIRFSQYYNENHLLRTNFMYICRALLKHGYSNFSISILEYCEPSKCLEREDYYLKKFNPEYNTSQNPSAPFSGLTHSDDSRKKISDAHKGLKKGEKNPMFGKSGENHPNYGKPRPEGAGSPSQIFKFSNFQAIEVFDNKNNQTTTYDSMSEAGRALNIDYTSIVKYFANNQKKSLIKVSILSKKSHRKLIFIHSSCGAL